MKTFRNFRENILEFIQSRRDTAKKQGIPDDREIDPDGSREKGLEASIDDLGRIIDRHKKPEGSVQKKDFTNASAPNEVKGNELRTNDPSPRIKVLGRNQNVSDIKQRNRFSDTGRNIARAR